MNYLQQQQHHARNYNSLDRCSRTEREQDAEFDDCGFDRRRFGSGRYVRNELDVVSIKHDNPDLVQFGNNANNTLTRRSRYDVDACQTNATSAVPAITYDGRVAADTFVYGNCECPGTCKGSLPYCVNDGHLLPLYNKSTRREDLENWKILVFQISVGSRAWCP